MAKLTLPTMNASPYPFRGGRPRLGVDVAIAARTMYRLSEHNIEVVYEAGHGEPDEVWFAAAMRAGVHVIVSPDSDLEELCAGVNLPFIRLPNRRGLHWREQATYIIDKLRRWKWISTARNPKIRGRPR
jgi:hypothetical protein